MASRVSKLLPKVSNCQVPAAGAVHRYQMDLPPGLETWSGSPASFVAPRLVPLTVPVFPVMTSALAKLSLLLGASTVNAVALVAVPPGVVTETGPLAAPTGTVAPISVAELTVKVAVTPLKRTADAPKKFAPVIVTLSPTAPRTGAIAAIAGAPTTENVPALVAVPAGVVMPIGPVTAPGGTVTPICVVELTVKLGAFTPPKRTAVVPSRFAPVTVTVEPTAPVVGEKPAIAGRVVTAKLATLVAVPEGV